MAEVDGEDYGLHQEAPYCQVLQAYPGTRSRHQGSDQATRGSGEGTFDQAIFLVVFRPSLDLKDHEIQQ